MIYTALFFLAALFGVYGIADSAVAQSLLFLGLIALVAYLTHLTNTSSLMGVLPFALGWPIILVLCDVLYAVPISGWTMFLDPSLLVGYGAVFSVPLITVLIKEVL